MAPTYRRDMPQYTDEMLQNIPQGVLDAAQEIYDQVTNPLQAAQGIYDYASHPLDTAGAAYGHYANRYKNLPVALDTLRKDPVGVAMDFSPLALLPRGTGLRPMRGEVLPPNRPPARGPQSRGPTIEGRATGPGVEDFAPRRGPPAGPGMSPPMTDYDRHMMDAYYRNTGRGEYGPYTPGARSGFAYKPEHMPRTSDMLQPEPGYVDLEVVKNNHEFYDPWMMDHLAERMRAGDRSLMRHELYGPNAGRPPYGQGGEGKGYWGERPNPGIEPRGGRGPDGFTLPEGIMPGGRSIAGVPAVRGGLPAPFGNTPTGQGQIPYSPRLPVMAGGGRNLVPTEIPGEFYEAYGLPGPGPAGRYSMPPMSGPGPSPAAMMAAGSRMPYVAPVAAVGGFGLGAGMFSRQPPVTTPLGGGEVRNVLMAAPLSMGPEYGGAMAQRGTPTVAGAGRSLEATRGPVTPKGQKEKRGKQIFPTVNVPARVPLPTRRPEELGAEQGFEPNLNYLVTQAIDRLVGQGEAERGRAYQQYYDRYGR